MSNSASAPSRAIVAVCALLVLTSRASEEQVLRTADWPAVRSGEAVLRIPALREAVAALGAQAGAKLFIRYPGGERGQALAFEVREWLVSLGVPAARIVPEPGSGVPEAITIEVKGEG